MFNNKLHGATKYIKLTTHFDFLYLITWQIRAPVTCCQFNFVNDYETLWVQILATCGKFQMACPNKIQAGKRDYKHQTWTPCGLVEVKDINCATSFKSQMK